MSNVCGVKRDEARRPGVSGADHGIEHGQEFAAVGERGEARAQGASADD